MIERKKEAIRDWLNNPVTEDLIKFLGARYEGYDNAIRECNYYRAGEPNKTQENIVALMQRRAEVGDIMQYFDVDEILAEEENE